MSNIPYPDYDTGQEPEDNPYEGMTPAEIEAELKAENDAELAALEAAEQGEQTRPSAVNTEGEREDGADKR